MARIHLYILDTAQIAADASVYAPCISAARVEQARAFQFDADIRRALGAELCLHHALEKHMPGYCPPPEYRRLPGGKPVLLVENLHISLAHAAERAVCAISDMPVGVDIEHAGRDIDRLASRMLGPDETGDPLSQWVAKESYVKLTGEGLSKGMRSFIASENEILDRTGAPLCKIARINDGDYRLCAASFSPISLTVTHIKNRNAE